MSRVFNGTDEDFRTVWRIDGCGNVAFRVTGWVMEYQVDDDQIICPDDECDHQLSEMCWEAGHGAIVQSDEWIKAVMIGDDREDSYHIDTLSPLTDDQFCRECGQIGCAHGS